MGVKGLSSPFCLNILMVIPTKNWHDHVQNKLEVQNQNKLVAEQYK